MLTSPRTIEWRFMRSWSSRQSRSLRQAFTPLLMLAAVSSPPLIPYTDSTIRPGNVTVTVSGILLSSIPLSFSLRSIPLYYPADDPRRISASRTPSSLVSICFSSCWTSSILRWIAAFPNTFCGPISTGGLAPTWSLNP